MIDESIRPHKVRAVITKHVVRDGLLAGTADTKLVLLTNQDDARDNGFWLADEGPWERPDIPVRPGDFVEHNGAVYRAHRPREEKHYRVIGLYPVGVWAEWVVPGSPSVGWRLAVFEPVTVDQREDYS